MTCAICHVQVWCWCVLRTAACHAERARQAHNGPPAERSIPAGGWTPLPKAELDLHTGRSRQQLD